MKKKQAVDEAKGILSEVLEYLKMNKDVAALSANDKRDFFLIFSRAFRAGYCTVGRKWGGEQREYVACDFQRPLINGNEIREFLISSKWIDRDDQFSTGYLRTEKIGMWWDEWTYAWDNCPSRPTRRTLQPHSKERVA